MISFVDIEEARERIREQIYLSPFPHSETISQMTGNRIFFKLENLQLTGSFKERGALNRLLTLTDEERDTLAVMASYRIHKRLRVSLGQDAMHDLVELVRVVPRVRLEIRYATSNNFLGTPVYEQARAFLQRPAAEALARVAAALRKQGYGVLVFDAYRPWYVTKIFWDATPVDKKQFVADPAEVQT